MRTRNLIVTFLLACVVGILAIACSAKTPAKVSVDKDISVAIYSTTEREGAIDTVSPCLLTETVHISELLRHPDDDGITMPFTLSNTAKYAEITGDVLQIRQGLRSSRRTRLQLRTRCRQQIHRPEKAESRQPRHLQVLRFPLSLQRQET